MVCLDNYVEFSIFKFCNRSNGAILAVLNLLCLIQSVLQQPLSVQSAFVSAFCQRYSIMKDWKTIYSDFISWFYRLLHTFIWATTRQNVSSGVSEQPDTNRPAQPQKLARVLKFRLYNLEILYYLSSEQQRRWSGSADAQADLRLCCSHMI